MKVYGDLDVTGDKRALVEFIVELENHLKNGWVRYHEREIEVRTAALGPLYCFACTSRGLRPASELWMATHADGSLYISNIIAQEFSSLSYDQYNTILLDFYSNCAKPAAETVGVVIELGNPDPQLDDFMSPVTAELLRNFSALANRSALHPYDRKRWNEFLAAAYKERASLSPDILQRWLIEEEKWPEDEAINLAIEYEHARDLLQTFQSQQV